MRLSFGPDSNVITDSTGRMVFLSDAELTELGVRLAISPTTNPASADVARAAREAAES
jgi:hypothetical protein